MAVAGRTPYRLLRKGAVRLLLAAGVVALLWDGIGRHLRSTARDDVRNSFLGYLDALREASPAEMSLDKAVLAHVIEAKMDGEGWFVDASISTSHGAFLSSLRDLNNLSTPSWLEHDAPRVCRFAELTDTGSLRGLQVRLTQVRACGDALSNLGLIEDPQDLTRRLNGTGNATPTAPESVGETSLANFIEPLPPAVLPRRTLALTDVEVRTHLYRGGVARSWLGAEPQRCPEPTTQDVRGCQGAEIAWRTWEGEVQRQTVLHPPGLIIWTEIGLGSDGTAFFLGSCRIGWKEGSSKPLETSWCLRAVTPEGELRDVVRPWSEGDSLKAAFTGESAEAASPLAEAFGQPPPRPVQGATLFSGSAAQTRQDQYWIGDEERYGVTSFDRELLVLATRRGSVVSGTAVPLSPSNVQESLELWRRPDLEDVLVIVSRGAALRRAGPAWVLFSLDRGQTWQGEASAG